MALIQWNDSFSVGVPRLDQQHRQLVAVLNELHEALSQARGKEVLAGILARLNDYALVHLKTEEKLLQSHGYPDFVAHKAQHDAYVAKMRALLERSSGGHVVVTLDLMQFLKKWWSDHILTSDRAYSSHLRARNAA